MYIIVAGGGKVGYHLAQELLEGGSEVLVVERDPNRTASISDDLGGNVMQGDSCEVTTLDAAGVSRADLIAAVTGDDEDNLVICEIARKRGVPRTIARINNPKNELLFKKRGIETTISATQAVLAQIEQELPDTPMIPLLQLHSGLELVEIKLPAISPAVGRSVREVLLPPESLIALIVDPGGVPRIPSGDTRLHAGDALVIVTLLKAREAGPAIVDEARDHNVDVIILGVGYKRLIGSFQVGRTAEHVLNHASCQVWVVRQGVGRPVEAGAHQAQGIVR